MKLADQSVEREQVGRRGAEQPRRRAQRRSLVPDVVGQTAVAAIDQLRATGLNPAVEHQPTEATEQHGVVLAQEPAAAAEVPRGVTLAVWVGVPNTAVDQVPAVGPVETDERHAADVGGEPPAEDADPVWPGDDSTDGGALLDDDWYAPAAVSAEPLRHSAVLESDEYLATRQAQKPEARAPTPARHGGWWGLGAGAALTVLALLLVRPLLHDDRDHAGPASTPAAARASRPVRSSSISASPRVPRSGHARRPRRPTATGSTARTPRRPARRTGHALRHRPAPRRRAHLSSKRPASVGAAAPSSAPASAESPTASEPSTTAAAPTPSSPSPDAGAAHSGATPSSAARAAQQEFFTP